MLGTLPDFRSPRKKKHRQADVLACFIIGTLVGKTSIRRIVGWCKRHTGQLEKYMPLTGGIPSVSTFSRILAGVDEELLMLTFTAWMEEILDPDGAHIAVDGKGLRAAAGKIMDEPTPYILNAINTDKKLVISQMAIPDKTNERGTIPEFLGKLDIRGSLVTIDAAGTTGRVMNAIREAGADFMLQVKKDNPGLYKELLLFFRGMEGQETDPDSPCSSWSGSERNRERREYRRAMCCSDEDTVKSFREWRPHINSIGYMRQVRIKILKGRNGNDITPTPGECMKKGQSGRAASDEADAPVQEIGIISSRILDAEQMAFYKRRHWRIENSLHYILDVVLGEDRSTIRRGKTNAALLRKAAYNTVRFLILGKEAQVPGEEISFVHAMDEISENWEIIAGYIFQPVVPV